MKNDNYVELQKEPFFNIPRLNTKTSASPVGLPMLFSDSKVRQLNYFIEPEKVDPFLEGTGLIPCRFFNGKCLVSMIFYSYCDVSIGAYDEVTIVIFVHPEMLDKPSMHLPSLFRKNGEAWDNIGCYVLEMPVTIPEARAAGRELWGFPKFETEIPFKLDGNDFEFSVKDPETDDWIVEVKGSQTPIATTTGFSPVSYSNFRGNLWPTIIDTDVKYKNCKVKNLTVKVGKSTHGMAKNIKTLGLDSTQPFMIQSTDNFRSRLNPGKPVADWPTPEMPYAPKGGDGEAEGLIVV